MYPSLRKSTWFIRPFILVREWGLETRLESKGAVDGEVGGGEGEWKGKKGRVERKNEKVGKAGLST